MNLNAGASINLLPPDALGAVLAHPAQQENAVRVARLIEMMRECAEPADYDKFQKHLFQSIYRIEERRAQCSRVIKRLRRNQSLPTNSPPPPPPSGDPSLLNTWQFEAFIYERLARQLRTVGDGLAWRCFGYDRRIILTLARNASPGPMYGKEGLGYELGRVNELWNGSGHFSLLHDLTNCLRIADITEFTADGGALFREIKKRPHTKKAQIKRIQAAVDALVGGGLMPGDRPGARLIELTEPYKTGLGQLSSLLALARKHGNRGMKLAQGRAIVATSLSGTFERWGTNIAEADRVLRSTRQRAIKRARIAGAMHHLRGVSADTASRSPIAAPWSIYPFSPTDCAAIICDLLIFETIVSVDGLAAILERVGLNVEILLMPKSGKVFGDLGVLRIHLGSRALTLHGQGLNCLLYELLEPDSYARAIRELLTIEDLPSEPVFVFSEEAEIWHH